jgi:hypothetical protein
MSYLRLDPPIIRPRGIPLGVVRRVLYGTPSNSGMCERSDAIAGTSDTGVRDRAKDGRPGPAKGAQIRHLRVSDPAMP